MTVMSEPQVSQSMVSLVLLTWSRCLPLFVLAPYVAWGVAPGLLGIVLSFVCACAVLPLCAATGALVPAFTYVSGASELARGLVIALGCSLPFAAVRMSGAVADALTGGAPDAASSGKLARLSSFAALVIAISADGLSGVLRVLLDTSVLPAVGSPVQTASARELFMALAQLVVHAVELAVSLSGPLLLCFLIAAVLLGLGSRVLPQAPVGALGSALMPWFAIGLLSLCLANWLDAVPDLVRTFARSTTRLLAGLP